MNREAKQEIRRILLGRTQITQDGRLVALEKGQFGMLNGVADGAGAVRFLGIRKKSVRLDVSFPERKAQLVSLKLMRELGRVLYLEQSPEAVSCLIRYVLTRPAVLVFDYEDGVPILTAFSGRGLTGWISNRRAIKSFLKRMPKQMSVSSRETPLDEDERKKEEKKRNRKEQKKAAKEEKAKQSEAGGQAAAGNPDANKEAKQ